MSSILTTSLELGFEADKEQDEFDPAGNTPLTLALHDKLPSSPSAYLALRLYPQVPATLNASVGSVAVAGGRYETIEGEAVQLSGSSTASASKYIENLISSYRGIFFDVNGNQVGAPSITAVDGTLQVDPPVYGAVFIDYQTSYYVLNYVPETEPDENLTKLGSVYAFYKGSVTSIDIPIAENLSVQREVITVSSEIVLTESGAFEKPVGFPDNNTFPGTGITIDTDAAYLVQRRVHAFVNRVGNSLTTHFLRTSGEVPYVGMSNPPVVYNISHTIPEGASPSLISAIENKVLELWAIYG